MKLKKYGHPILRSGFSYLMVQREDSLLKGNWKGSAYRVPFHLDDSGSAYRVPQMAILGSANRDLFLIIHDKKSVHP
ncbi:MAG: hypothetical protein Q7V05_14575, partial [Methanoregula sp.]|nr:hypothetical protein [Methanoregula sp.]